MAGRLSKMLLDCCSWWWVNESEEDGCDTLCPERHLSHPHSNQPHLHSIRHHYWSWRQTCMIIWTHLKQVLLPCWSRLRSSLHLRNIWACVVGEELEADIWLEKTYEWLQALAYCSPVNFCFISQGVVFVQCKMKGMMNCWMSVTVGLDCIGEYRVNMVCSWDNCGQVGGPMQKEFSAIFENLR